jgi:hypothetical protein
VGALALPALLLLPTLIYVPARDRVVGAMLTGQVALYALVLSIGLVHPFSGGASQSGGFTWVTLAKLFAVGSALLLPVAFARYASRRRSAGAACGQLLLVGAVWGICLIVLTPFMALELCPLIDPGNCL